jgi:hypothetical protein
MPLESVHCETGVISARSRFSWRARVRMLPLVTVQVVDRYAAGEGMEEVRLFGRVRMFSESGQHVSEVFPRERK